MPLYDLSFIKEWCRPNVGGVVGLADLYVDKALGFSLGWAAWVSAYSGCSEFLCPKTLFSITGVSLFVRRSIPHVVDIANVRSQPLR